MNKKPHRYYIFSIAIFFSHLWYFLHLYPKPFHALIPFHCTSYNSLLTFLSFFFFLFRIHLSCFINWYIESFFCKSFVFLRHRKQYTWASQKNSTYSCRSIKGNLWNRIFYCQIFFITDGISVLGGFLEQLPWISACFYLAFLCNFLPMISHFSPLLTIENFLSDNPN